MQSTEGPGSDVAASPSPLLSLDFDGRIFGGNPEAFSLLGFPAEEVLFHRLEDFFPLLRAADLIEAVGRLPEGAEIRLRSELERKDRSRRPVRLRLSSRPEHAEILVRLGHDRRAEDRLLEEAEFGRAVLATSEGPVLVLNSEDRIVLANRACEEMAGASFSELRGTKPWDLCATPEESDRARFTMDALRTRGVPTRGLWTWRARTGAVRLTAWRLSLYRVPGVARPYVLATGHELTEAEQEILECRRARDDVRSALERVRSIVDSVPALISYIDRDGRYVFANRRYQDWFGRASSEIEGKRVDEVVPAEIYDIIGPRLKRALAGETVSFETVVSWRPAELRSMQATYVPDFDEAGRVRGVFTQVHDVTELRRVIHELSESQAQLKAILDQLPAAIALIGGDERFLMCNREFARHVGFDPEAIQGKGLQEVFPSGIAESMALENDEVFRSGAAKECEDTWLTPSGPRTFHSVRFPLCHADGSPYAVGMILTDVSERNRVERERRRLNETLEDQVRERTRESERALEDLRSFTYGMAHNLRAPLRAMFGFGQVLREDFAGRPLDISGQSLIQRIQAAAQRMDALLQGLLDFGRVAGERLDCRPLSLAQAFRNVLKILSREIAARSARIEVPADLSEVCGDRSILELVLIHLLSNAIKFVAPGVEPRVAVHTETRAGRIRVIIEDNGIGISPDHRERIFGLFEHLNLSESYPGTGIGLSIVRKAMERMKGQVGFESEPGKGSRFWIELPAPA